VLLLGISKYAEFDTGSAILGGGVAAGAAGYAAHKSGAIKLLAKKKAKSVAGGFMKKGLKTLATIGLGAAAAKFGKPLMSKMKF